MKEDYHDIRDLIDQEPLWFDSNGTPRYADFNPDMAPNTYSREVILLEVECQNCQKRFLVELHSEMGCQNYFSETIDKLQDLEHGLWWYIGYGDPPRHGCIGDTMNSIILRIVEFWQRPIWGEWERAAKYEIEFDNSELEGGDMIG